MVVVGWQSVLTDIIIKSQQSASKLYCDIDPVSPLKSSFQASLDQRGFVLGQYPEKQLNEQDEQKERK